MTLHKVAPGGISQKVFGPVVSIYEPYGEFGILSNFSEVNFVLDDLTWLTAEHFFQAQKFVREEYRVLVREALTGRGAKATAWSNLLKDMVRPGWDEMRVDIMRRALQAKFLQSRVAQQVLLSTWPLPIVENSPTDDFWGLGPNGRGRNWLGHLLEETRELLGCPKSPMSFFGEPIQEKGGGSHTVWTPVLVRERTSDAELPPPLAYQGFLHFNVPEMLAGAMRNWPLTEQGDASVDIDNDNFLAHASILDQKYARYSWYQDSRSAVLNWKLKFFGLLAQVCKQSLEEIRIVAVGAGSANEASQLWASFSTRATLVDWGFALVENCRQEAPMALVRRCRAEHLDLLPDGCADVYCSLRTFDSALLDISIALREAHRVVRAGGCCVLSISNGYLGQDGTLISGQIGENGSLDKFRPWDILLRIAQLACGMNFVGFEYFNIESEIVLCFRRS